MKTHILSKGSPKPQTLNPTLNPMKQRENKTPAKAEDLTKSWAQTTRSVSPC